MEQTPCIGFYGSFADRAIRGRFLWHSVRPAVVATMNETQYWAYYNTVRSDLMKAAYCYFAGKAIHTFAGESRDNLQRLNAHATFWMTTLHGLQVAWFMALSRLFDEGSDTHDAGQIPATYSGAPGVLFTRGF